MTLMRLYIVSSDPASQYSMQIPIWVSFCAESELYSARVGHKTYVFKKCAVVLHDERIRALAHERQLAEVLLVEGGVRRG